MNRIVPLLLSLAVAIQLASTALLVRGAPQHHQAVAAQTRPGARKAFLRWGRDEQFARSQDRERFREELTRTMHQLMQNHTTKNALANIENEAIRDLEKRFSRTNNRIDRMKDHTVAGINDLIALT